MLRSEQLVDVVGESDSGQVVLGGGERARVSVRVSPHQVRNTNIPLSACPAHHKTAVGEAWPGLAGVSPPPPLPPEDQPI